MTAEQKKDAVEYLRRAIPDISRKTRLKNDEVEAIASEIFSNKD